MKKKDYIGLRVSGVPEVRVHENGDNRLLDTGPSQAIVNHSPDGFEWSFGGSGPSQLALAILLDFTGDQHIAQALYMDFKWSFVAYWSKDSWTMRGEDLQEWLKTYEMKHLGAS